MEEFVTKVLQKTIKISKRIIPGWAVLAKEWVVERRFAWLNHFRRLSKDYEIYTNTAKNFVMIAHPMILVKRLT
jgi:transposase